MHIWNSNENIERATKVSIFAITSINYEKGQTIYIDCMYGVLSVIKLVIEKVSLQNRYTIPWYIYQVLTHNRSINPVVT